MTRTFALLSATTLVSVAPGGFPGRANRAGSRDLHRSNRDGERAAAPLPRVGLGHEAGADSAARHFQARPHVRPHRRRLRARLPRARRRHARPRRFGLESRGRVPGRGLRQGSRGARPAAGHPPHDAARQLHRRPRRAGVRRHASRAGRAADRRGRRPGASAGHRRFVRAAGASGRRRLGVRRRAGQAARRQEPAHARTAPPHLRALRHSRSATTVA